jgi:integrase
MQDDVLQTVTSQDIIKMLRASAATLKLEKQNINPDLIGAHSLRAGGAMALRLHGYDDTTIQKMGRWTSNTFLQYIHTQIAHLSKDISQKMSIPLPFLNIAAIET